MLEEEDKEDGEEGERGQYRAGLFGVAAGACVESRVIAGSKPAGKMPAPPLTLPGPRFHSPQRMLSGKP